MKHRLRNALAFFLLLATAMSLAGCEMQVDDSIFDNDANYSVDIALPYATVTPPPAAKEEAQALMIDAAGSVTVNDSAVILQNDASESAASENSNYKSLRQGNTGLAVQALQQRLAELGYFSEGVSGIFDSETEAAVRRFEQSYGTMQTGVATAELQQRLFSADAPVYGSDAYNKAVVAQYKVLERGDVGSSVYALQQRLKNLGYPLDELTGVYDNETANAVMLFYEEYGMTASDAATVALQKELYSDSARPYGEADLGSIDSSASSAVGASIADAQERLIELGYMDGTADGDFDQRTQIAVKLFEEACGQLPSGTLSSSLLKLLSSKHAPRFEVLSSQYENLLEGSGGDAVRRLQERLVALGYAVGTPNGEYGSATTESVRLFQNHNYLEETGIASVYVQAVLYSSFALNIDGETTAVVQVQQSSAASDSGDLTVGSVGDAVLRLQQRLTELGYVTSMTGSYDNLTGRAVSSFQETIGLEPDGVADQSLLDFLYSSGAPRSSDPLHSSTRSVETLSLQSEGDAVKELQQRLRKLGLVTKSQLKGSNGVYNQATADAVSAVQTALGYESIDGVATPELQCYIFSDAAEEMLKED